MVACLHSGKGDRRDLILRITRAVNVPDPFQADRSPDHLSHTVTYRANTPCSVYTVLCMIIQAHFRRNMKFLFVCLFIFHKDRLFLSTFSPHMLKILLSFDLEPLNQIHCEILQQPLFSGCTTYHSCIGLCYVFTWDGPLASTRKYQSVLQSKDSD